MALQYVSILAACTLVLIIPVFGKIYLEPISNIYLPYEYAGTNGLFGIDVGAVEQSAYDNNTGIVYAGGSSYIHIVDFSNITNPEIIDNIPSRPITDVELCGSMVAFSVESVDPSRPGEVHVYDLYNRTSGEFRLAYTPFTVGYAPDMLQFTADCSTIVVANEAEPYEVPRSGVVLNPEGSVSVIRFGTTNSPTVSTLNFRAFDARAEEYVSQGVRWHYKGELGFAQETFSQNLEPEYVTINGNGTKAYVTLQENNAIAEVNLETNTIDEIYPLGVKDWANLLMDSSDRDEGINLQSYDISSLRMPDGLTYLEVKGDRYIITANEGDTLGLAINGNEWVDAKRGRQLIQDDHVASSLDESLRSALADDTRLGRLEFSIVDGFSNTEPTKISRLHFLGARGISLFRAEDMSLLWDSGDLVETSHLKYYPSTFNGDTKPDAPAVETPADLADQRSDNQGPECETVTIGDLDGTQLVFVGVDRASSILIFSVNEKGAEPSLEFESTYRGGGVDKTFDKLLEEGDLGDLDPEDLRFIPGSDNPTDKPLLLVTGAVSGTLTMYEVIQEPDDDTSESTKEKPRKNGDVSDLIPDPAHCDDNLCVEGTGLCRSTLKGYYCKCRRGYRGKYCNIEI